MVAMMTDGSISVTMLLVIDARARTDGWDQSCIIQEDHVPHSLIAS